MDRALAERLSTLMVDAALDEIEVSRVLIRENLIERMRRELLCFDDRAVTLADVRESVDFADRADGGATKKIAIAAGEISGALRPRKSFAEVVTETIECLDQAHIDPPVIKRHPAPLWAYTKLSGNALLGYQRFAFNPISRHQHED